MAEEPQPTFEDALGRIERIVDNLERGEPSLSTALAKYEDGVKLLRRCYDLLDQAERSVAILTGVDEQGHPLTAPFDATATLAPGPDSTPTGPETPARTAGRKPPGSARPTRRLPTDPSDSPF